MSQIFELYIIKTTVRDAHGSISDLSFGVPDDTCEFLDTFLEPFNKTSFEFFRILDTDSIKSIWPWAVVLLDREYPLAGHIVSTRHDHLDVIFTAYSLGKSYSIIQSGPPPVSILFFRTRQVLSDLSSVNPLYSACWSLLKDQPEDQHWLGFLDPLPADWVKQVVEQNDSLFDQYFTRGQEWPQPRIHKN